MSPPQGQGRHAAVHTGVSAAHSGGFGCQGHRMGVLALAMLLTVVAFSPGDVVAGARAASVPGPGTLTSAGSPRSGWDWPLQPAPPVARGFDPPAHPWSAGHRGVDLAGEVGQPVLAPAAGTVTFSGVIAGRGVLVIAHPSGLRSTLEPVAELLTVGTAVGVGDQVASLAGGASHCAPLACLHWGVRRGVRYLDPLLLLRGGAHAILLPMDR